MTKENQVSDVTAHYLAMRDTLIENGAYKPPSVKDDFHPLNLIMEDRQRRKTHP